MNKLDLTFMKKQFNSEKGLIQVDGVYTVYINGDSREILSSKFRYFQHFEEDIQELLYKNIKKVYSGNIDVKIFVQEFVEENMDDSDGSFNILSSISEGGKKDTFIKICDSITQKIISSYVYDKSIAVFFYHAYLPTNDGRHDFIICTINKADAGKSQFVYMHNEKNFDYKSQLDPVINMTAPIEGFAYPVYEDRSVNGEKVMYYSSKSNKINGHFVSNVLNCNIKLTAKQEKTYFHSILNSICEGKIAPNLLYNIYDNILKKYYNDDEEEGYKTISLYELDKILKEVGINVKGDLSETYKQILGTSNYNFKVINVVPDISKRSICLENVDAEIKIRPDYLENVKQVESNDGDMYLLIRLNENLSTNGLKIETESLEKVVNSIE